MWPVPRSPFELLPGGWFLDTLRAPAGTNLSAHVADTGQTWYVQPGGTDCVIEPGGATGSSTAANYAVPGQPAPANPILAEVEYTAGTSAGNVIVLVDYNASPELFSAAQIAPASTTVYQYTGSFTTSVIPFYAGSWDSGTHTLGCRRVQNGTTRTATLFIDGNPYNKVSIVNTTLDDAQVGMNIGTSWTVQEIAAKQTIAPPSTGIVCAGDSLTWGYYPGATDGGQVTGNSYPAKVQAALGGPTTVEVSNLGIRGYEANNFNAAWAVALLNDPAFTTKFGVYWLGINDCIGLAASTTTVGYITAAVIDIATAATACLVCTLCHVGPNATPNYVTVNALVDQVNLSIRLFSPPTTYPVVDLAANALLNDYTNTTYRDPDQLHFTPAGYALIASLVLDAIP